MDSQVPFLSSSSSALEHRVPTLGPWDTLSQTPGFAFGLARPLPCSGDSTSGPVPPHRAFGSPPPRSRASRQRRACGCRAPAARCTAATPSASTRLGSAPRRNRSSTALRSGCQSGPQPSPRAPSPSAPGPALTAVLPSAAPSAAVVPGPQPHPCPRGPLAPRLSLPVSNFPLRPCTHALRSPSAPVTASVCRTGAPARLIRDAPATTSGLESFSARSSGSRSAGPGAADKGWGGWRPLSLLKTGKRHTLLERVELRLRETRGARRGTLYGCGLH